MKIPKIPRWIWLALKGHLDMSKGVDRLIQRQLQPGSVVRVVLNRTVTVVFLWGGSILALTVLIWGLTVSKEVVEKVRDFLIKIPKRLFWVVSKILEFIGKFF